MSAVNSRQFKGVEEALPFLRKNNGGVLAPYRLPFSPLLARRSTVLFLLDYRGVETDELLCQTRFIPSYRSIS